METNRFKQFHTLYQTKNLRRAAELLGISHSGLSKSMATLESEMGEALFTVVGRGIAFTDKGHEVAGKIPSFLKELDRLIIGDKSDDKKVLKIGSFEVFTTYFAKHLGPLLSAYDLDFHELTPGKMERALLAREIDLAITYEPIPLAGIEHLKVGEIEMAAFVKKGSFKGSDILEIPFAAPIIPIENSPTGIKGLDGWPDHKIRRNIRFRVDLMETAISLARNGYCAVFLPIFVVKLHNEIAKDEFQLVKKSLPPNMKSVKRSIYVIKRESTLEDSVLKKLAQVLRSL